MKNLHHAELLEIGDARPRVADAVAQPAASRWHDELIGAPAVGGETLRST